MSRARTLFVSSVVVLSAVLALFPTIANVSQIGAGKLNQDVSRAKSPTVLTADGTDPMPSPIPIPWRKNA